MSLNKRQLKVDSDRSKKPVRKDSLLNFKSKMGYRDDSPFRNEASIDIHTPTGMIDMSQTGIPLMANGRILPPYSGQHQFAPGIVNETPIEEEGGEPMHQMPDGSWMKGEEHDEYEEMELEEHEIEEYRRGGYIVEYQDGGMTGMMKSKIAMDHAFGNNPAIQRMIAPTDNPYHLDDGNTGTHFMSSQDNYAVPQIQQEGDGLQLGDYGPRSNEAIRFNTDDDANYFAKHYKEVAPAFKQNGGGVWDTIKNTVTDTYDQLTKTVEDKDLPQHIYETVAPTGYVDPANYFRYLTNTKRDTYIDPRSEEAFKQYLGINKEPKYLSESKYKPSQSTDPNATYYTLDEELNKSILEYAKKLKVGESQVIDEFDVSRDEDYDESGYNIYSALGNFTIGRGKDDQGEYVSYYDKYDFKDPAEISWATDGNLIQDTMKGTPFEIYNRIYDKQSEPVSSFQKAYDAKNGEGAYAKKEQENLAQWNDEIKTNLNKKQDGGDIIKGAGNWEYQKRDGIQYARQPGRTDWLEAKGHALDAIQEKVYNPGLNADVNRPVSTENNIYELQKKLKKAGYELGNSGPNGNGIDGDYGPLTQAAAFAYDNEIPPVKAKEVQNQIVEKNKNKELQNNLLLNDYSIGFEGATGFVNDNTLKAIEASEQGVSAEDINSQLAPESIKNLQQQQEQAIQEKNITDQKAVEEYVITAPTVSARIKEQEKKEIKKPSEGTWSTNSSGVDVYTRPELKYDALTSDDVRTPLDYEKALSIYDDLFMKYNIDSQKFEAKGGLKGRIDAINLINTTETLPDGTTKKKTLECAKGALDCESEFVSSRLGLPSTRSAIHSQGNITNTPYSLPSTKSGEGDGKFKHNYSYDSWEIADSLLHSKKGFEVYNRAKVLADKHYDPYTGATAGLDFGKVALGSLVLTGGSDDKIEGEQPYVPSGLKDKSRHTMTVIAFDEDDGMPIVYDYGTPRRLDDVISRGDKTINHIITPNTHKGYNYSNLNDLKNVRDERLGINKFKEETGNRKYHSDEGGAQEVVNEIYGATDEIIPAMSRRYNMPINVLTAMQNRVLGIGVQESNLYNEGPREEWSMLKPGFNEEDAVKPNRVFMAEHGDDPIVNRLKTTVKSAGNSYLDLKNSVFGESTNTATPWQVDVRTQKKIENGDTRPFNEVREEVKDVYDKKESHKDLESSVGPFKVKYYPQYLTDAYGTTKKDLEKITDKHQALKEGSKVALAHIVETYQKLKKENPNYTDEELIDLATIGYNSGSKVKTGADEGNATAIEARDYHQYLREGKVTDDYLNKVDAYSRSMEYKAPTSTRITDVNELKVVPKFNLDSESTRTTSVPKVIPKFSDQPASGNALLSALGTSGKRAPNATAATTLTQRQRFVPRTYESGGEYEELELSDEEIEELKRQGYRIEEM